MSTKSIQNVRPQERQDLTVEIVHSDRAAVVTINGLIDERFTGFGSLQDVEILIIDVARLTRMTSFGVRQWLKALDALPTTVAHLYLVGCPTFFVDQLNMVLGFGANANVLTVVAPYTCTSCGTESGVLIDVLAERVSLAKTGPVDRTCAQCGNTLEFDDSPESYFAFVNKYSSPTIPPEAAQVLAVHDLYISFDTSADKPPKILKIVHGSVTYFRITGTIGSMFRARPFMIGAEGEVVIDLAEVDRFEAAAQKEWRRLLKNLSAQVDCVTLVDVKESYLNHVGLRLSPAKAIALASVLVPFGCTECGRVSHMSVPLKPTSVGSFEFAERVCPLCGGTAASKLSGDSMLNVHGSITAQPPPASAKLIEQRQEILSRAVTDAKVARAGEEAVGAVAADDMVLGKYKIVRRLSEGGMAEVFLATQIGIGGFEKPVALKRIQRKLLESRHQAIELFLNEAKIAGRLIHPNIVQVLDVGEVQGALYLAMEYVHGRDVREILKRFRDSRSTMSIGDACHIVREVARALDHAYWSTDMNGRKLSVVHRDVSPQNIILGYDGSVKLLDFGVAMSAVTEHAETLIVGKWLYMAPEVTMHEPVDHRSDLFSLGVILYLLCSGLMPFSGREPREIVKKIQAGRYKPLQEITPLPDALVSLIDRLLAPNPNDRPQRGQDVVAELTEIAQRYGFSSSSANIASLVSTTFPERATSVEDDAVRFEILADVATMPRAESFTPAAPLDVSVSLRPRRSGSVSPLNTSTSARHKTPLPTRPSKQFQVPQRSITGPTIVMIIIVLIVLGGGAYVLFFSDFVNQF